MVSDMTIKITCDDFIRVDMRIIAEREATEGLIGHLIKHYKLVELTHDERHKRGLD